MSGIELVEAQAFPSFPASKSQLPHPGEGANSGNSLAPAPPINLYGHLQIPKDCRSQSHLAARGHYCLLPATQAENAIPEKALTCLQLGNLLHRQAWQCVPMEVSDCWEDPENLLCPTLGRLLSVALSPVPGICPRTTTRIPGITPPSQRLLPLCRDCSPIPGTVSPSRIVPPSQGPGPHRTSSRDSMRRGGPGKPLQWGNGNVAKQLLPASDSSVPQRLCQITRINMGRSPSRGAGNSQHDV